MQRTSPPKFLSAKEVKIDFKTLTAPGHVYKILPPIDELSSRDKKMDRPLRMFTLGCADGGVAAMRQVAELMGRIASGERFHVILILGDNFDSNDPPLTLDSNAFLTHLHDVFSRHPILKKIPKFVILGNHDVMNGNGINPAMIRAQLRHTYAKLYTKTDGSLDYLKNSKGETELDLEKIKLFTPIEGQNEIVIPYEKLLSFENQWFMPSTHYSLAWGDTHEIICTNTNTLVTDFLVHIDKDAPPHPFNQMRFLLDRTAQSKAPNLLVAGHHPIVDANDKRTISSDHPDYVSTMEYDLLVGLGIAEMHPDGSPKSNHTDILFNIFFHSGNDKIPAGPGHKIKMFIVAHHHAIDLIKKHNKIQIKSGGAGGPPPLQNRYSFKDAEQVPAFLKNNGVVSLLLVGGSFPNVMVDIYGLADPALQLNVAGDPHLQFSLTETPYRAVFTAFFNMNQPAFAEPLLDLISAYVPDKMIVSDPIQKPRDTDVAKLSDMVIKTCKEYQFYLGHTPPPYPWQAPNWRLIPPAIRNKILDRREDDVILVDSLLNYFNSYKEITLERSVAYLRAVLIKLGSETILKNLNFPYWHALFDAALKENYGISYREFITDQPKATNSLELQAAEHTTLPLDLAKYDDGSYYWPLSTKPSFQIRGALNRLWHKPSDDNSEAKAIIPQTSSSSARALLFNIKGLRIPSICSPESATRAPAAASLSKAIPIKKKAESKEPALTLDISFSPPLDGESRTKLMSSTPRSFSCTLFSPLGDELNTELEEHYVRGSTPTRSP